MELVEREPFLDALLQAVPSATSGGRIVLVAGEAGIGKTSLLNAFVARLPPSVALWWGACDALQTPIPLGPLLDIARGARVRFRAGLDAGAPRAPLFEAVLDELRQAERPTVVVIEDAHWADEATLDWLKHLGRRIASTSALLVLSYRDDEVQASHPLRRLLGELPSARLRRLPLPRLTPSGVERLARAVQRSADGVHALTQGNAFFVTELLRHTGSEVPATVQDLVLARYARLPPPAQALVRLASVAPARIERWLVDAVLAPAVDDLGACLASGLLLADAQSLHFRHELARVAVESSLVLPVAQSLHAQVLRVLAEPGREALASAARRAHHALHAGDAEAVRRWAPLAAQEAQARDAHRQAVAHWKVALAHADGVPAQTLEHWLAAHAEQAGTVGLAGEALDSLRRLEQLARDRGDLALAALRLSQQMSPLVSQLRHREAGETSRRAVALVEPLPASPEKAQVWYFEGWLRMLDRDCEDSVHWASRALELAQALGERRLAVRALGLRGTARLLLDYEAGRAEMHQALDAIRAEGWTQLEVGTLLNLGSGSGEMMRLREAEGYLREAIALSVPHEFDGQTRYCQAWLALCLLLRGHWDEAAALASEVAAHADSSDMSRLMATLALGRLRVRRGDPGADEALDAALALAGPSSTLQRIGPTRAARAEAALVRGDPAAAAREVAEGLPLAQAHRHPWFIGELAYWGWRAGASSAVPQGCAEPYALQIAGRWDEAAQAWQRLDCPYEQARALAEGDEAAQREALAIFDRLGARPAAEALRRRLREAGARGIVRGARESTRSHPLGLTRAEAKVLALMCEGLRNADIASKLHRSVRTVDHHVAAVLAKLGASSRLQAVQRAQREALVPQSGQSGSAI